MYIQSITNQNFSKKSVVPSFKATDYLGKKILEKDVFSIKTEMSHFSNPIYPEQNVLGVKIIRENDNTINLVSRYNNKTGVITYNPNKNQPEVNIQIGSFQPIIEIKDEELGLTVLMTRGSVINGGNFSVSYNKLANNSINFDYDYSTKKTELESLSKFFIFKKPLQTHSLVVTTGYMPEKTNKIVDDYQNLDKKFNVKTNEYYMKMLKDSYTMVGLGGGMGTRLKPISDLGDNNKLSTPYPGSNKTLFEISVLDAAHRVGNIDKIKILHDDKKELLNTGGIIIKGLKEGVIDKTKPLVVLTGDTCHNIDLARALKDFEDDKTCGMALVVNRVYDVQGKSCVKFVQNEGFNSHKILDFSDLVNAENSEAIKSEYLTTDENGTNKGYYSSTNILIISPQVLKLLEKYAKPDGSADLTEFLGLMYNSMNNTGKSLYSLYPQGLPSKDLTLSQLRDCWGRTSIKNSNGEEMLLKAIIAKDIYGNDAISEDVGTIEDYFKTVKKIANDKTFDSGLTSAIKSNMNEDGVLFFDENAQEQLKIFKEKYSVNDIKGNVIVYSSKSYVKPENISSTDIEPIVLSPVTDLYSKTDSQVTGQKYISELMSGSVNLQEESEKMLAKYGSGFLEWYMSPKGYYGAYESFVDNLFKKSKSIDELLKFMPNWAPWKLEEKKWLLENPYYINEPRFVVKNAFDAANDRKREQGFEIGSLPSAFNSSYYFEKLIAKLKKEDIKAGTVSIGHSNYYVKRLKGGELNDKFIYTISDGSQKYIVKFDRTNLEDCSNVDGRELSLYEKKNIRKNKYLAADSIYSNACISRYLELNGCENIPKMYYYNQTANAAIYEYIEDRNQDKFQRDLIDEEYDGLTETNLKYKSLNDLGIYLNDTAIKNTLVDTNGMEKIIDLGHSNFYMPFKPGVKHYNIEFSNTNGPDVRAILASLTAAMFSAQALKKMIKVR